MHTMTKRKIAAAVSLAAAALAIVPAAARAQSSVTLYGILDAGVTYVGNSGGARLAEFGDGVS